MKKIIFGLLSMFLITPVFASQVEFVVSSGGSYYLCYVNNVNTYTSTKTYYISPFRCGSINSDNSFSESFTFNNSFGPFSFSQSTTAPFALRFFGGGLKYSNQVDYMSNSQYYYSFPISSLTTDLVYPGYSFFNTLVYTNLDIGSFLSFNGNSIRGSLYNNYYFESDSYFSDVSSYYYNLDISSSSVSLSGDNYSFVSIFDDIFSTNNSGKIISFDGKINGVLLIPLLDYGYNYLTGSHTMLLKNINGNLVYNILDCFSSQSLILKTCSISDRGYFTDLTFFNNSGYNFNITPSYVGGGYYKKYKFAFYSGSRVVLYYFDGYNSSTNDYDTFINRSKSFELTSNFSVPDILSTVKFPITTGKVEELIDIYCNQLHLINPALCNNGGPSIGSGAYTYEPVLSGDQVVLVITDYSDTNDYIIHTGEDGEIWIECVGDWCPIYNNTGSFDIGSVGGSGFILDTGYYENFFNKTGYFAKCPYPYTDLQIGEKLKIVQKIKNSIGDFDIFLPINCSIAAFTAGKTYKFLSDVNMGLNPLMGNIQNSEDPRVYFYKFFDFLMSFALIVFLLKIYHLLN